jgi:myo-inositol-1-phosphate synthase
MIQSLRGSAVPGDRRPLRAIVRGIQEDIREFTRRNRLRRVVVVNLASTEPLLRAGPAHQSPAALERALARNETAKFRASTLYAFAAADLGLPFLQFAASNGALVPGIQQLFELRGAPYMGFDGKTGETLVKSALAPMFKYRNLRVLTWQGYNILGDRDGAVLADEANKRAKISTKDHILPRILGYPLHTHVGIDYVPSLKDLKTAWDFIHFAGFLDFKMSMQFIWQGCDSILAAPILLDMIRFAELAERRGEKGRMLHLACYFKKPVGMEEHDLHKQWHLLTEYVERARPRGRGRRPAQRRPSRSSTKAPR